MFWPLCTAAFIRCVLKFRQKITKIIQYIKNNKQNKYIKIDNTKKEKKNQTVYSRQPC